MSFKNSLIAPKATIKPKKLVKHKDVRIDNYYWLNDKENPDVIDYLKSENEYTKQETHTSSSGTAGDFGIQSTSSSSHLQLH